MMNDIDRPLYIQYYASPCGKMLLASVDDALCLCDWSGMPTAERNMHRLMRLWRAERGETLVAREESTPLLWRAMKQLDEYFASSRRQFDLPLHPAGTDFQRRVWSALLEIPYGETRSYKDIAQRVGNLKAIRAVAQAIGANGLSILIPCHRVVGSDGSLTGFAGGLEVKKILLEIERRR